MAGIYGIFSAFKKVSFSKIVEPLISSYISEEKTINGFSAGRNTLNKFMNDKIFNEDEELFIMLEGVVFNSNKLKKNYAVNSMFDLLKKLYVSSPYSFPSVLDGNFSGAVYDKKKNQIKLFTCQNGAKQLFYFYDELSKTIIFGSELKNVAGVMKQNGYKLKLSENGANCMLSIGYMIGETTLVEGIKKIEPGTILTFDRDKIDFKKYFVISSYPIHAKSEDAIIEELDNLYIQALKSEYEKDVEYGYRHIATLSGGLDSRMNVLNAHRMGFKDLMLICFSENGYLDETISKQIASDMKDEYMFYSLNNGTYLKDIDHSVNANDGLVFYSGSSYMYSMISKFNMSEYGLMHTGVAGNEVLYTSLQMPYHDKPTPERLKIIFYSTRLYDRVSHMFNPLCEKYETMEQLAFYEKVVNGMYNAFTQIGQFTEYASPSIHAVPLDYIMKIDPKLKYNAGIYIKWALKKVPYVNNYRWEHIAGAKLTSIYAEIFMRKALKRVSTVLLGYRPSKNPWAKWMKSNSDLMSTLNNYYDSNINILQQSIKSDAEHLYRKGTLKEKTQVLTLLSGIKNLHIDG